MLTSNSLRIDRGDGSSVVDYRIENGSVETRTGTEGEWKRVTPEQLSAHVMSNTVVAQWLRRRMGLHRLLRACNESASHVMNADRHYAENAAA